MDDMLSGFLGAVLGTLITSFITLRLAKKRDFIDVTTKGRLDFVQELRRSIAEYCALAKFKGNCKDYKRQDELKFKIHLLLNPDDEFDKEVFELIKNIEKGGKNDENIEALIKKTQSEIKLEWEGIKRESTKGILTKKERNKLRRKYFE